MSADDSTGTGGPEFRHVRNTLFGGTMSDRDDIERELLIVARERDKWKSLAGELVTAIESARAWKTEFWTTTIGQEIGKEFEWGIAKAREAGL